MPPPPPVPQPMSSPFQPAMARSRRRPRQFSPGLVAPPQTMPLMTPPQPFPAPAPAFPPAAAGGGRAPALPRRSPSSPASRPWRGRSARWIRSARRVPRRAILSAHAPPARPRRGGGVDLAGIDPFARRPRRPRRPRRRRRRHPSLPRRRTLRRAGAGEHRFVWSPVRRCDGLDGRGSVRRAARAPCCRVPAQRADGGASKRPSVFDPFNDGQPEPPEGVEDPEEANGDDEEDEDGAGMLELQTAQQPDKQTFTRWCSSTKPSSACCSRNRRTGHPARRARRGRSALWSRW